MKVEVPKREKSKSKAGNPRVQAIRPSDVLEILGMFLAAIKESPWEYPSLDEHTQADFADWLYFVLSQPTFAGMSLRVGRKSVGYVIGQVVTRPLGKPRQFSHVIGAWIAPEHRSKETTALLKREYFAMLKASGIHHWEANLADKMIPEILGGTKGPIDVTVAA